MKILHITKKYPKALGGDTVVVSNLQKCQEADGHKVSILTSNCEEIINGEHIYKFGLKDKPAALDNITPKRLVSLVSLFFKSFKVIRKERPDIIHTHSIDMAFVAAPAAKLYKVPMVHTFHIVTFHDKNQSWLRRKTELLFNKGAAPKIVTAPNDIDVAHLREAGEDNAVTLHNGIDLKFWNRRKTSKKRDDTFTFISAGRFENQKGYEYLIKAVALLKERTYQPFKVVLVGDGSLSKELAIQTIDKDIVDYIEFTGRKTAKETRQLLASSDVAVLPSLWESTPLSLLEAWAMGLPVISTEVGILQEPAVGKYAELVAMRDEESLANAMQELMTNAERRTELADAGKLAVQAYTWKEIYQQADHIYKDALAVETPPAKETKTVAAKKAPAVPIHLRQRDLMIALAGATVLSLLTASYISGTINALVTLPLGVLIPGLLLKIRSFNGVGENKTPVELSIAAALGLLIIAAESLAINWLLPVVMHISSPLQAKYLVPIHAIVTLVLLAFYLIKEKAAPLEHSLKISLNWQEVARFAMPLLLPLLAVAGAFRLNNGAGNQLTVIALGLMVAMSIWFVVRPKLFNPSWLIFNIALGLLLSASMRSWFISGFDISQEFQVFTTALNAHHWSMAAIPGNPYNACLSLTTIPVALQQMTGISPEFIFKFFYQVVFAITAVVSYAIARRFADKRSAFLVALLYVSQAQFFGTMPAVVRQEMSFLFFGLIIYLLLQRDKLTNAKKLLLILMSAGMVVTHYSTTYVALFVLASTGLALLVYKLLQKRLPQFDLTITLGTITKLTIFIFLLAFVWYSQVNAASGNVSSTIRNSLHNMPKTFTLDKTTSKAQLILGGDRETADDKSLQQYAQAMHVEGQISAVKPQELPTKSKPLSWGADRARDVLAITLKLATLGPIVLLAYKKAREDAADISFLGIGSLITLTAILVLPALSVSYNFERVYQQCLIMLGITGLWTLWAVMPQRRLPLKTIVTAAFVLLYFVFTPGTGIANQLIGGTAPRMNLNSQGEEYDKYYVTEADVKSAQWLGKTCTDRMVFADRYANLRATAYGGINFDDVHTNILKTGNNGCLLLDSTNVKENLYYDSYKKNVVRYTAEPSIFDQHNLIYSNSQAKVFSY